MLSGSEYPLGGGPKEISCSQVLEFCGAVLPDGAEPVGTCSRQGRRDAPTPRTEFCLEDDADLCLDPGPLKGLPDGAGAGAVHVSVVYEDAGTALVRFSAFTV